MNQQNKEKEAPLAARLRPRTLEEVVGQQDIIGKGKLLYRAIKADKLGSIIFYGPPGTGKTTLAMVIAGTTRSDFKQINATSAGKKDMEDVIASAKALRGGYGRRTILFIDEIHRFNKGQQDYLLPFVEDGTITLIGATTENPYFEVNSALISRSMVFELHPLSQEDVKKLIERAVYDKDRGMGAYNAVIDEDAEELLADIAGGDARHALNAVELAVLTTDRGSDGKIHITREVAQECIQKRVARYDKKGDNHYDTISAFIKSMRGSDPDAAVYYLARMIEAGEDPKFIARRIMICASEDVGNADPNALSQLHLQRRESDGRSRRLSCRRHVSMSRRRRSLIPRTLPLRQRGHSFRRPAVCRFLPICRTRITRTRRTLAEASGISTRICMKTIIPVSSICRTRYEMFPCMRPRRTDMRRISAPAWRH